MKGKASPVWITPGLPSNTFSDEPDVTRVFPRCAVIPMRTPSSETPSPAPAECSYAHGTGGGLPCHPCFKIVEIRCVSDLIPEIHVTERTIELCQQGQSALHRGGRPVQDQGCGPGIERHQAIVSHRLLGDPDEIRHRPVLDAVGLECLAFGWMDARAIQKHNQRQGD